MLLPALVLAARTAGATTGNGLYLGATLEAQQLVRTPSAGDFEFIQQRNTLRLLASWTLLEDGELTRALGHGGGRWSWIENAGVFLLYRGVYDSVYDFRPSIVTRKDYRGVPVPPPYDDFDDLDRQARDALKYENRLREAYVDLEFPAGWLLRAGRQQVVWGASDGYRVLDRVNSLDLTWHQYQSLPPTDESFDEIRVPAWMLLLRKNGLGLPWLDGRGAFAELVWNPGDWSPNKVGFLPTPWGIELVDPLIDTTTGQTFALEGGTELFQQGRYTRDPADNSQVGIRIGTDRQLCDELTSCKLQGSLVYLYHRFTPWGGASTSAAPLFESPDAVPVPGRLPFFFDAPYVHTAGVSLSWVPTLRTGITYPIPTDENWWLFNPWFWDVGIRFESTLDFGVPFYECDQGWVPSAGSVRCRAPAPQPILPPTRDHDIWSGVLAADVLNSEFGRMVTSFQLFWTYLLQDDGRTLGSLDFPSFFGAQPATGFRDDVRRWEVLTTFTAARWFAGGRIRLSAIHLLDWVNSFSQEVAWGAEYKVAPGLSVELSQRFLINPKHEVNFEPWSLAGLNRGRSEIGLRIRYELPTLSF